MYVGEDSSFVPNLIIQSNGVDVDIHKKRTKPFSQATNRIANRLKNNSNKYQTQNQHIVEDKQNKPSYEMKTIQRKKIVIDFDLQYEEEMQESQRVEQKQYVKQSNQGQLSQFAFQAQQSAAEFIRPDLNVRKNVLLQFQSEEEDREQVSSSKIQQDECRQQHTEQQQLQDIEDDNENNDDKEVEDEDNEVEDNDESSQQQTYAAQKTLLTLGRHVEQVGIKYYLQSIPKYKMLQVIIRRQKQKDNVKYHVFDSSSLVNFMTILKDQDGYIFLNKINISKDKKYNVVAKLISNFFGTEFNCYLMDVPYKNYCSYGCNPKVHRNQITIQYQTNIFGLKGPRKMTAFIPKYKQKLISNKSLNEIYEAQKKKKQSLTIDKYRNKTPKWSNQINSFVLNFHGRATESSIKNFIMIHENQKDEDDDKLLFGKTGKEIFNLDISHPFNIVQALSLAISSFDRKLACQ